MGYKWVLVTTATPDDEAGRQVWMNREQYFKHLCDKAEWPGSLVVGAFNEWSQMRSGKCGLYQAIKLMEAMIERGIRGPLAVTKEVVFSLVAEWQSEGLGSGTINKRLSCLPALGVSLRGWSAYRSHPRRLKWWLKPQVLDELGALLRDDLRCGDISPLHRAELWKYVQWATRTGLRVEESLRLRRGDFSANFDAVTVPGTKTLMAQMTLPLSRDAREMAEASFAGRGGLETPMFFVGYHPLSRAWLKARRHLGITDKLATLKAFRRTAARFLTAERGMPLDVLRQYLRHENVKTTEDYLRLTGGYSEKEMRRWLG